ncbi:hypothetical protein TWF506_007232 [Arthrobotrys conoides]|uniref:Lysine-specific metallo-endopeptidase domain-containing protein n=1 Tax=Arthrobotrys conoides TaxID=74498 RepID=A0AAN8PH24_9PEZI
MWGVKKLVCRAIIFFPLLLKPSFQAGISTCFQVVTQDLGACSPADIQTLDGFYYDAVALLRAGINLYDNYKTGTLNTFSQSTSFRNGLLYFGLMLKPSANGPPIQNVPDDELRWQTVRSKYRSVYTHSTIQLIRAMQKPKRFLHASTVTGILSRTQRFLAGENVLNIANKPYMYCHGWWLERIPDETLKLVEDLPSPSNPNSGQIQVPYITVFDHFRRYLVKPNGERNDEEVWWNRISRKYYVQKPLPEKTLGMSWEGDGAANLRPRVALVNAVFTKYARRLVTSKGAVTRKSGIDLYYTGAVSLVHEIVHLVTGLQTNDDLYGAGDILITNKNLVDRMLEGKETNDDLNTFDKLQYTADAYAWYCLSAYLSSVSEVTLDFSTSEGSNAEDFK